MIVLKIIIFILLAIFGIILLLLILPVQAEISFIGEKVRYRLKYAFINFLDSDGGGLLNTQEKTNKVKKGNKSKPFKFSNESENNKSENIGGAYNKIAAEEIPNASDKERETNHKNSDAINKKDDKDSKDTKSVSSKKKSLGKKVGFIMDIWRSAKRPLRKIFKGIRITDIYIDFMIADEDAYKCALKYGRIGGAVYNFLAIAENIFTIKYKTVDVTAGFAKDKSRWDAGAKVTFLPITAVISGIWFGVTYIFRIYLPGKKNKKKSAAEQKMQP